MSNTKESIEKLAVYWKSLLDIVEKSQFCTSHGRPTAAMWAHYYIFPVSSFTELFKITKVVRMKFLRQTVV